MKLHLDAYHRELAIRRSDGLGLDTAVEAMLIGVDACVPESFSLCEVRQLASIAPA